MQSDYRAKALAFFNQLCYDNRNLIRKETHMKRLFRLLSAIIAVLVLIVVYLMWKYTDNTSLQTTLYTVSNEKIPSEFNGFRIAQVADLHNAKFGENNEALLAALQESDPDIIVFTGDQIDARKPDPNVLTELVKQAVQIAPCYLVSGNHEGSVPRNVQLETEIESYGVVILDDEIQTLECDGASIELIGLEDATRNKRYYSHGAKTALEMSLQELEWNEDHFSILLAHRPEYFYVYERNGIDLAICGHVHGGQIRIRDRGLIGPGKELFPEYDCGVYTIDEASMVLSRGLGNSIFPWRINNPPELVIIELESK